MVDHFEDEYESLFDKFRDQAADYTTPELKDAIERIEDDSPPLSIKQHARVSALEEELEDREDQS